MRGKHSRETQEAIKKFLIANPKLGHTEAANALVKKGYDVNRSSIHHFRSRYSIRHEPQGCRSTRYITQAIKDGRFVSAEKLVELFGINENYAKRLSRMTKSFVKNAPISPVEQEKKEARRLNRIRSEIGLGSEWVAAGIVCGRAIFKCGPATRVHTFG